MSQKRMFDRAIIDTDKFMDLSMSAKALYFLMGMEADDEGFVSPRKVLRIHGGNDDDIRILVAKNFVIPFESGVVVITDWNKNNWLDSRRIKATEYQKEKKLLTLLDDKTYAKVDGLAPAKQELSQYSIEESSIEESSTVPAPDTFEVFWKLFPNRRKGGKKTPKLRWDKLNDESKRLILQDLPERVAKHKDWLKNNGDFIPAPEVYLNKEQWLMPIIKVEIETRVPQQVDRFTGK